MNSIYSPRPILILTTNDGTNPFFSPTPTHHILNSSVIFYFNPQRSTRLMYNIKYR